MNLFPVAAAMVVLLLVVVGFFGLLRAMEPQTEEAAPLPMIGNQPEFFSTIRPETLNNAEVDLVDDPTKSADLFENSLFVGDGQMAWLKTQQLADEQVGLYLEKALFMTSDQYSWESMQREFEESVLTFSLYGESVSLPGTIRRMGIKKVFILMGRYDLLMELPDTAAQTATSALLSLKQACPDTEIVVLTLMPNMESSGTLPANSAITKFNAALRNFCAEENGIVLADTAALFPETGLPEQYCADPEESGRLLNAKGTMLVVTRLIETLTEPAATAVPTPTPTPAPETESVEPTEEPADSPAETVPQTPAGTKPQAAGRGSIPG